MRSSKLDECFDDPEEREFLAEEVEASLHEAREALAQHEIDAGHCDTAEDLSNVLTSKDRQKRKIKFFALLHECLGGDHD